MRCSTGVSLHQKVAAALSLGQDQDQSVETIGAAQLPSCFAVTELAAATMGAVGSALAQLIVDLGLANSQPAVTVDQRLASLWFAQSIHPIGWTMPPAWDSIAGDYKTSDGWIKLHTNLPHHRAAALSVLQVAGVREKVTAAVGKLAASELETAIVSAGGVAAAMRSRTAWKAHPQGGALAAEPLIHWSDPRAAARPEWAATSERPLNGLRVLDLTRVLAGPVATRTLAGFGAEVLRIDPPGWDEGVVVPDITLGKRCSYLALGESADRVTFEQLLARADVLVHGYRPGALDGLGYGAAARREIAPDVIDVSLDGYGWTGPWRARRGFDSLVQMSCGIAEAGMQWAGRDQPTPLPVQALDHATGYLMAAAAVRAIARAVAGEGARSARLSLARTGELLAGYPQLESGTLPLTPDAGDFSSTIERTPWGPAHRLAPAVTVEGTPMRWNSPACAFGSTPAAWS